MRTFRSIAAVVTLASALIAAGPAGVADPSCTTQACSGTVAYPWITPGGGEVLNSALGANGTFGFTIDPGSVAAWRDRSFRLVPSDPAADLDVYFYIPATNRWDFEAGVHEGPGKPEQGAIPEGTQRAFVALSYTTPSASPVPFTYTVT